MWNYRRVIPYLTLRAPVSGNYNLDSFGVGKHLFNPVAYSRYIISDSRQIWPGPTVFFLWPLHRTSMTCCSSRWTHRMSFGCMCMMMKQTSRPWRYLQTPGTLCAQPGMQKTGWLSCGWMAIRLSRDSSRPGKSQGSCRSSWARIRIASEEILMQNNLSLVCWIIFTCGTMSSLLVRSGTTWMACTSPRVTCSTGKTSNMSCLGVCS